MAARPLPVPKTGGPSPTLSEAGRGELFQVPRDVAEQLGGERDGTDASSGLRGFVEQATVLQLGLRPADADGQALQVDVSATEGGEFAEPQSGERRQEDEQPIARGSHRDADLAVTQDLHDDPRRDACRRQQRAHPCRASCSRTTRSPASAATRVKDR